MKKIPIIFLYLVFCLVSVSQDSITKKKIELSGYIKDMQSFHFAQHFDDLVTVNLIHNRLNFKWKPSGKWQGALEVRNRVFWGDQVYKTPGFRDQLKNNNEAIELSALWLTKSNFVLHTNIERLWMEYRRPKWNIRAGRQRINWGVSTTWNPGDIFNTYNFLDFDYEERPGSDAAKLQYIFNDFSSLEIAVSPAIQKNQQIAAARYTMNRFGYDIQFILGRYHDKLTAGFGWAGSLGNIGFKGEGQFYSRNKDSNANYNLSIELDYIFANGWYVNGALLYNHNGLTDPVIDRSELNFEFSPMNLMPSRWNTIIASSKEITPLFTGRWSVVYCPKLNLIILLPSFQYNLSANLDADIVWQSFFLELDHTLRATNHGIFARLKWSF